MNTTDSLGALRRANPRHKPDCAESAVDLTRKAGHSPSRPALRRWPVVGIPAVAIVVIVVATLITVGSPVGPLVVSPAEAMQQAVIASATAAESSGTVLHEITQDRDLWVARTLRWNGSDLSIANNEPSAAGRGDLLVVDGIMYGPDPEVVDGWIEMGSPDSVDPHSGTTPDEYLAAITEDVGGATIQRITDQMTGVKEGKAIRVLPFGNVAHDDANDPASLIDISLSVRPDGTFGEIHATWGGQSSWSYRLI